MKQGQLSVIIIVGLFLLIIVSMSLYVSRLGKPTLEVTTDLTGARQVLQSCLEEVATGEIFALAAKGGQGILTPSVEINGTQYAVGVENNNVLLPPIADVEANLAAAIGAVAPVCTVGELEERGIDASYGDAIASVTLTRSETIITLDWPVALTIGDSTTTLSEWIVQSVPLIPAYPDAILVADNFINEQDIDLTFTTQLDSDVAVVPLNETSALFITQDTRSMLNNTPLAVAFVARSSENLPPTIIGPIVPADIFVGAPFSVDINAIDDRDEEGNGLSYNVDSPTLSITDQGILSFEPVAPGNYDVVVTVIDSEGATDQISIPIKVLS